MLQCYVDIYCDICMIFVGDTGDKGDLGEKGNTGFDGPKGIIGEQGIRGPVGNQVKHS